MKSCATVYQRSFKRLHSTSSVEKPLNCLKSRSTVDEAGQLLMKPVKPVNRLNSRFNCLDNRSTV
jgi:hypothetical protein